VRNSRLPNGNDGSRLTIISLLDISTLLLHYEDYASNFNEVTSELFEFLELPHHGTTTFNGGFKSGKTYDYFTKEERRAMMDGMRALSTVTACILKLFWFGHFVTYTCCC
jgi:hypothetical protein